MRNTLEQTSQSNVCAPPQNAPFGTPHHGPLAKGFRALPNRQYQTGRSLELGGVEPIFSGSAHHLCGKFTLSGLSLLIMSPRQLLRNHFFTGLLVITPIAVVGWILTKILSLLWSLQKLLPEHWRPEHFLYDPILAFLLNLLLTLGATLILVLGVSILGWTSQQVLGQKALELFSDIIQRIPVLRSIYGALDQLVKAMAPENGGQQFKRVVYVEWPRKGIWAIAFVTSPAKAPNLPDGYLNIFLPATPNPTSGFHMIIDGKEVRESHLSVEDAFKTILSLGIAQPQPSRRI